jgi:hypothetical protein
MPRYVRPSLCNLASRALYESLSIEVMTRLADRLIPGYDLYARTGYPRNIPLQIRDAADQIAKDMHASYLFLPFIEALIALGSKGMMGRVYQIPLLRELEKELKKEGLVWNEASGLFIESWAEDANPNWMRLREGEEAQVALLRFDVCGNTKLVRRYGSERAKEAYGKLFGFAKDACRKANGRVWHFEGDGALLAFLYGEKELEAVLCGMETLHELFLYNSLDSDLETPLSVRMAVHTGKLRYSAKLEERDKSELVVRLKEQESEHTGQDRLTVSQAAASVIGRALLSRFERSSVSATEQLYSYGVRQGAVQ